jgi:hypothetical protein
MKPQRFYFINLYYICKRKKRCEKTKGVNRCEYRHIPMYTFYMHTESETEIDVKLLVIHIPRVDFLPMWRLS